MANAETTAIPTRKDVIPIEIEATIDVAMQTNAQMDLKGRGRTASATVALSLPGQIQIPQWSFRLGLMRRGARERAILRRRHWRGFCSLCSGSVVFGWHFASPFDSHCKAHCKALPLLLITSPLKFLFNPFFLESFH
jgi:hypothetical protein